MAQPQLHWATRPQRGKWPPPPPRCHQSWLAASSATRRLCLPSPGGTVQPSLERSSAHTPHAWGPRSFALSLAFRTVSPIFFPLPSLALPCLAFPSLPCPALPVPSFFSSLSLFPLIKLFVSQTTSSMCLSYFLLLPLGGGAGRERPCWNSAAHLRKTSTLLGQQGRAGVLPFSTSPFSRRKDLPPLTLASTERPFGFQTMQPRGFEGPKKPFRIQHHFSLSVFPFLFLFVFYLFIYVFILNRTYPRPLGC